MVTKQDIISSFKELGVLPTDILLVHSSLKSFGYVDGGAETVIEALKEVVCDGTLVMPALRQKNFDKAYVDWNVFTTPSDVGLITETFRKSKGVLRSNQETHSVCAFGKDAKYITEGHSTGKPRFGSFGDYAFGHNSPWERMYELGAKVAFIGIDMTYNTFKHYCEQKNSNDILDKLPSDIKAQAQSELHLYGDKGGVVWFGHSGPKAQEFLTNMNKIRYTKCGDATLTSYNVKEYVDIMCGELYNNPSLWLNDVAVIWVEKYKKFIR